MEHPNLTRRAFLAATTMTAAGVTFAQTPNTAKVVPRKISPNEKVNVAGIGVGGMGFGDIRNCGEEGGNIVAICDVDWEYAAPCLSLVPEKNRYKDYREMLDKQKDIDAVMIATPDHTHAVISMDALRAGKHVYCEKPLSYTVHEAREMTKLAKETGAATQMGNRGHAMDDIRKLCEWIWDGAIGDVYEVHAWTPHPVWPQGIDRPTDTPPVPDTLDWDLWLGPAPERPYHPWYHPVRWRGWWDFGTGGLGDMGCHILDHTVWALKLGPPTSVEATYSQFIPTGSPLLWDKPKNKETFPRASMVTYQFPAREGFPPLKVVWYDGGIKPPHPEEMPADAPMGDQYGGALYIGTEGKIITGSHGARDCRLIPAERMESYKQPEPTIPRSPGHIKEWLMACKGEGEAGANFAYSGPLTETVLLGNISMWTDKKLYWDSENFRFTNDDSANQFLHREYRDGWVL